MQSCGSRGRYERNEVFPSIDIARKIADILEVSLDYLTGKEDVQIDKNTSSRILEVSKFEPRRPQSHLFCHRCFYRQKKNSIYFITKANSIEWLCCFIKLMSTSPALMLPQRRSKILERQTINHLK